MILRLLPSILLTFSVILTAYCQPANNECSGALPLPVESNASACTPFSGTQLNVHTDGTTRSDTETSAVGVGEYDRFYTWSATTRGLQPNFSFGAGIRASVYENLGTPSNPICGDFINSCIYGSTIALSGWEIGDNLIVQVEWDRAIDAQFSFCFSESALPLPANDECSTPVELACQNQWQSFDLAGSTGEPSTTCNLTRPLWFKISDPDREFEFEIRSNDNWVQYEIFTGSDCNNLTTLLCTGAGSFQLPPNNQPYYIAVGTNTNAGGPNLSFEIRRRNCSVRPLIDSGPGVTCAEAIPTTCAEEVYSWDPRWRPIYIGSDFAPHYAHWLTVDGLGQELAMRGDPFLVIYEGNDCGTLTKLEAINLPHNSDYYFTTTPGKKYYFLCIGKGDVLSARASSSYNEIKIVCRYPPANSECANAEQLDCGSRLAGTTKDARFTNDPWAQSAQLRTVYYSFIGNGQKQSLFLSTPTPLATRVNAHIYSDSCRGPSLDYTYNGIAGTPNEIVWQSITTSGQLYYVSVGLSLAQSSQGTRDLENFEIWLECDNVVVPVNDEQANAIDIACDQAINVPSFGDASAGTGGLCLNSSPSIWYKYESDGSLININTRVAQGATPMAAESINVCVLKEVGGQLSFIDAENNQRLNSDYENLITFPSELGVTYYLVFALESNPGTIPQTHGFEFSLDCIPPLVNDFCSGAIDVSVQQPGEPRMAVTTVLDNAYPSGVPTCSNGLIRRDIWYKFVAPPSGVVVISDRDVEVFLNCSDQEPIKCNSYLPHNLGGLLPGHTYYLRSEVSNFNNAHEIYLTAGLAPPVNDSCGGALVMVTDGSAVTWPENQYSSTTYLNHDAVANSSMQSTHDAWYAFVAPATGLVKFEYDLGQGARTGQGYSVFYGSCDSLTLISNRAAAGSLHQLDGLIPGRTHYVAVREPTFNLGSSSKDVQVKTDSVTGDGPENPEPLFLAFGDFSCRIGNHASFLTPEPRADLQCPTTTSAAVWDRWKFIRVHAMMPWSTIKFDWSSANIDSLMDVRIDITATPIGANEPEFCFGPFTMSDVEFELAAEDLTLYEGYDFGMKISGIEPGLPKGNIRADICMYGEHYLNLGIAPVFTNCREAFPVRDTYGGYYYLNQDGLDVAHFLTGSNPAGSIEHVRAQSPLPNGEIVLPRSFTFVPNEPGGDMDGRYRLYYFPSEIDRLLASDPNINSIRDIKILVDPIGSCDSPGSSYTVVTPSAAGFTGFYYFIEIDLDLIPRGGGGVNLRNGFTMLSSSAAVTSSTHEVKYQRFDVFPQPATESVRIDLSHLTAGVTTGSLHDLTGRLVKPVDLQSGQETDIYVGNLLPGYYSLQFSIKGRRYMQRLAVQ